jgi:PPM family protein phosphatase
MIVGRSDIGRVRARNEDSVKIREDFGLAIIADGMGGHPGGDTASGLAALTTADDIIAQLQDGGATRDVDMARSVSRAHEALRAWVAEHAELEGMGTTLTALLVESDRSRYLIGHVGDSRAYRLRASGLERITRDDSWVQDQIDAKVLTPEQAGRHPYRHLLSQCVGLEDVPTPRVYDGNVEPGDGFLLCTDGLTGHLDDESIQDLLIGHLGRNANRKQVSTAVDALVDAAIDAGGYDNVTVALVVVS